MGSGALLQIVADSSYRSVVAAYGVRIFPPLDCHQFIDVVLHIESQKKDSILGKA